jgi:hypothetical protein
MSELQVVQWVGWASVPPDYLALFEANAGSSFFFSPAWFENFEATVMGPALIWGVQDAQGPVAAWVLHRAGTPTALGPTARLASLGNYYTSLHGVVLGSNPAQHERALQALVKALCTQRPGLDVLSLNPLDAQAPQFEALTRLLKKQGWVVQNHLCFGNWYLEVAGRSYADYFAKLSSSLRKNIPYYTRKIERNAQSRIQIWGAAECAALGFEAQLNQALQDYDKVYTSSWKVPEPYPQFIPGWVRACAQQGWLRLGLVYVEGEPAAAQIWVVRGAVASIFKLAYDARFSKLSVGTVLTAQLMAHVIDVDRVSVVDYLTGDDDYKKEWMSHRRERWGIEAFNPRRPRGAWLAARYGLGQKVRPWLKALAQTARRVLGRFAA